MTLIIGIEDPANDRAIMFADSGVFHGDHGAVLSTPKIWRNGPWIVGMAGSWKDSRIIRETAMPLLGPEPSELQIADALGEWGERVLRRVGELHAAIRLAAETSVHDTPSIVVARGALVFDCEDCAVIRTADGWQPIGLWPYATGALSALDSVDGLTSFDRGLRAMQAVDRKTNGTIGPFRWMATDGTEGVV